MSAIPDGSFLPFSSPPLLCSALAVPLATLLLFSILLPVLTLISHFTAHKPAGYIDVRKYSPPSLETPPTDGKGKARGGEADPVEKGRGGEEKGGSGKGTEGKGEEDGNERMKMLEDTREEG